MSIARQYPKPKPDKSTKPMSTDATRQRPVVKAKTKQKSKRRKA